MYAIFPTEFLFKNPFWMDSNRFAFAHTIPEIWEDQKSYFNGLKINIEPYLKWIKNKILKSRLMWTCMNDQVSL